MTTTVGVVGASRADARQREQAAAVGAGIARAGAALVCGGLGGVMAAACEGARSAGGLTIGILPGGDAAAANPHVQVAVPTGLGELRNGLIVRTADAIVAVGGAYGTLSEIALALTDGTPVVGLDTWELHRDGTVDEGVTVAGSPERAVELALSLAGRGA